MATSCKRGRLVGPKCFSPARSTIGNQNSGDGAEKAQQGAFYKALTQKAQTVRSDRHAKRHLLCTSTCTGQQQICNVGTGNEQYTENRRRQQNKQGTGALNRVSRERIDVGRHANGSAISVLLHETVRNLIHVRLHPLW